jgi:hypothetical protein
MMHSGAIHFYEVTARQCVVDVSAVNRQVGLELMLGAAAPLAGVLGPDEAVAIRMPTVRHLYCADCGMRGDIVGPAALLELDDNG